MGDTTLLNTADLRLEQDFWNPDSVRLKVDLIVLFGRLELPGGLQYIYFTIYFQESLFVFLLCVFLDFRVDLPIFVVLSEGVFLVVPQFGNYLHSCPFIPILQLVRNLLFFQQ